MAELVEDSDMGGWPPGTRHYRSGSQNVAVVADLAPLPTDLAASMVGELLTRLGSDLTKTKVSLPPTYVWACTEDGQPTEDHGMTPLRTFPSGLSAEDALAAMQL